MIRIFHSNFWYVLKKDKYENIYFSSQMDRSFMKNCTLWKEFGQFLKNSRLFTAQWDLGTQQDHFGQIELFEEMEQLCEVLQGQFLSVKKKKSFTN